MQVALFGLDIAPANGKKIRLLLEELIKYDASFAYYEKVYPLLSVIAEQNGMELPDGAIFSSYEDLPEGTDLFLALGGDGTLLNSLSIIRYRNIDVAGINFGRLGFLTAAKVGEGANEWIGQLLSKQYNIISRPTIKAAFDNMPGDFFPYALNEVYIQRRTPSMISVDLKIDNHMIPTYWADGLLIATPTGSTAYSLSVGGPIVTPASGVFVIAPIAPHNLNVRPLIVPDTVEIEMVIHSRTNDVMLTIDNRELILPSESKVHLSKGDIKMNTVSLREECFFDALKEKLLWGEDRRNII